jgi:hypothetical protein
LASRRQSDRLATLSLAKGASDEQAIQHKY